jgi:hypothetical protein
MIAISIANLHHGFDLLLAIGRWYASVHGRDRYDVSGQIGRGGCIWSGFVYNRRMGLRPSLGRCSMERQPNRRVAERRRCRSNRLDPRPIPDIVHKSAVGLSEFPSVGAVLAYLWNGSKVRRKRVRIMKRRYWHGYHHLIISASSAS